MQSAVGCIFSEQEITEMLMPVVQIPITGYEASNLIVVSLLLPSVEIPSLVRLSTLFPGH